MDYIQGIRRFDPADVQEPQESQHEDDPQTGPIHEFHLRPSPAPRIAAPKRAKARPQEKPSSNPHELAWDGSLVHGQYDSPLFHLPREIREIIWMHTLSQTEDSKPAHFHIFDVIFDSCTYGLLTEEDAERRQKPTQIGLLLTCRAVYIEALRYLYENTDFILVLLAGRARPRELLDALNNQGTIKECKTMLRRMRKVNLVLQPGRIPNADKYAARITELLEAANYFARTTSFGLDFNFHRSFTQGPDRDERFRTITRALYPLRQKSGPPIVVQPSAFWPRPPPDSGLTFNELQAELPDSTMLPWSYSAWKENYSSCSQRGFDHRRLSWFNPSHGWRRKAEELKPIGPLVALYVALFPVTAPVTYYFYRRRKFDKGEW